MPLQKNKITSFFLDLLFPAFCVGCNKEGSFLCDSCKTTIVIKRVPEHMSKKFGITLRYCATHYHTPLMRNLIAKYKYEFAKDIAPHLSDLLEKHLIAARFEKNNNYVIIPVPLHIKRERWRGFNQAGLIAEDIAQRFALPYYSQTLLRVKNTTPQIQMNNRTKRLENIKGAFVCKNEKNIHGKTVILVDDIATTGGTIAECAKTLKQSGAKSVIAFVIAS